MAVSNGNGVSRLHLYITAAGVLLTMLISGVGAIYWLTNLNARIGAVETSATQYTTKAGDIYKRQDERNRDVQDIRDRLTRLETSMTEVETQFCSQRDMTNMMHAFDIRMTALLWAKAFSSPFPTEPTYLPQCIRQR